MELVSETVNLGRRVSGFGTLAVEKLRELLVLDGMRSRRGSVMMMMMMMMMRNETKEQGSFSSVHRGDM